MFHCVLISAVVLAFIVFTSCTQLCCQFFVLVDTWESQSTTLQIFSLAKLQLFTLNHFPMYFLCTVHVAFKCYHKCYRSTVQWFCGTFTALQLYVFAVWTLHFHYISTLYICSVHTAFIFGICILYSRVWYFLMNGNVGL